MSRLPAELLQAAQAARLFPDSKTLVDMPLAAPPDQLAADFAALRLPDAAAAPEAHAAALRAFCHRWLLPVESDLLPAAVPQLAAGPPPGWLPAVADAEARRWAEHLFCTWGKLCRQAAPSVTTHPERHSLLALPVEPAGAAQQQQQEQAEQQQEQQQPSCASAPFIIPGARFREMYYWDTFWSLRGLLACGLLELAQGILRVLLSAVEAHGFVPNGLRSYYLNRSQPPLLSQMVLALHAAAPDAARLRRALPALLREHAHWTSPPKQVLLRTPDGATHRLSRYWAAWDAPRPESHGEDAAVAAAAGLSGPAAAALWRDLASAAESGWDFSSRWLADGRSLGSCRTTRVLPADLNALLYQMECNIASIASELGDAPTAAAFQGAAAARSAAIEALLWDESSAQWRDLLLPGFCDGGGGGDGGGGSSSEAAEAGSCYPSEPVLSAACRQSSVVAASNWVPLYCGCAPAGDARAAAAVASLQSSGLLAAAGVAVSMGETGQQWDWPNAWPPITCMLIEGCDRYGDEPGRQLAARLAAQFLDTAHAAWAASGRCWEKFDCRRRGAPGGGGEYEVVEGFGWTNGVSLLLLERYGWPAEGAGG